MSPQRANAQAGQHPSGRMTLWWSLGIATAAIVGVVVLTMDGGDGTLTGTGPCETVDGISHVHGLGIDHDDPDIVYVATHNGLIRVTNDTEACRLGPVADYMGFTMHPTDPEVFWASGHPGTLADRERLGPNMGVLKSTDGGHTWDPIALEGVDFHALTVSLQDPDRLWGVFAGQVYRSDDGGHEWDTIAAAPTGLFALAGGGTDRDTVYAATQTALLVSGDGGAAWEPLTDRATRTVAVHPDGSALYAVFAEGPHRSRDQGETWDPLDLDTGGDTPAFLAVSRTEPDLLYAASGAGALYKSTNDGATWTQAR